MAQLPTTGITVSLVAQTLGVGTTDVGRICTSERINKWSRQKPNIYPSLSPTMDQVAAAANGYYGFNLSSARIRNAADIQGMTTNVWEYNPPTGGADSPYRLGDFRGYNHNATVQYKARVPSTFYIGTDNVVAFGEDWIEGSVKFTELLSNYGLGTVYVAAGLNQDNAWAYGTGDLSLGGNVAFNINVGYGFNLRAAKLYIFLSDQPVNDTTHRFPNNTQFWCFPDGVQREFSVSINQDSGTAYISHYEISQWNYVNAYYNYIDFSFDVVVSDDYDGSDSVFISADYLNCSFTLTDEYGQTYSRDDEPATNYGIFRINSITNSGDNKTATVVGQISLQDYTTIRNYDGLITFSWTNGNQKDGLGGYAVSFSR